MVDVLGYDGRVQGVGDGHVLGWVWKPGSESEHVAVTIMVDGFVVAGGVANSNREDLADLGIGDGAHGFLVALPDELSGSGSREVVVAAGAEKSLVPPSPTFWNEASAGSRWAKTVFVPGTRLPLNVPALTDVGSGQPTVEIHGWRFGIYAPAPAPTRERVLASLERLGTLAERLDTLGIASVVACLPSKASVIGEALFGELVERSPWVSALLSAQHDADRVEIYDLFPALRAAARYGSTYDPSGLTLNGRGAFFAVRALLKEVSKAYPPITLPAFSDLHLCTDVSGALVSDPQMRHAIRMPLEDHLVADSTTHVRLDVREDFPFDLRLVLAGPPDSIGLIPWLADAARRTTYFCTTVPPMRPIELEMPHAVILLLNEHELHKL